MADNKNNGGGGEVVDRPEDRGGPMAIEGADQTAAELVGVEGAVVASSSDGGEDQQQEIGSGGEGRAREPDARAMEQAGAMGPNIEPMGPGSVAEASSIVDRSLDSVDGSGAVGDVTKPSGSPPRDSTKGKGIAVEEEQATEDVTVGI
ncbi:hypothetical protein RHMOL_Rhmol01G0173300 [Rhododendron molle]|uniref:Uncharacterized protein n=1 Tax=Rhododendron molle TaxID=49168 RepID=A0ACC0Q558_RHOML|nr:hypothetical protein RHMOL_Rhmol01G0173300 [Rhododendron molle]